MKSQYSGEEFRYLRTCYSNMKQRCLNPRDPSYRFYGGRGITICDRWLESCENFIEDILNSIGHRPQGVSQKSGLSFWQFDRINCNGDYAPGNCRWLLTPLNCGCNKRPRAVKVSTVKPRPRKRRKVSYADLDPFSNPKLPPYIYKDASGQMFVNTSYRFF